MYVLLIEEKALPFSSIKRPTQSTIGALGGWRLFTSVPTLRQLAHGQRDALREIQHESSIGIDMLVKEWG